MPIISSTYWMEFFTSSYAALQRWFLKLASDVSTAANTTPVTVTGLVFTFEANSVYLIDLYGAVSSAAAGTGYSFQLDVSAAVTEVALTTVAQLANTGTATVSSSIADNASVGIATGVPTLNTLTPITGRGKLVTGANTGTCQLMYRSETTAVTTAKAGLVMTVTKVPS